jgi:hypothetical protein
VLETSPHDVSNTSTYLLDHAHAIIRAMETIVSIDETVSSIDAAIAVEISQPQQH